MKVNVPTASEALDMMDGYYPPEAEQYDTEPEFHADLKAYVGAFMEAARSAGYDMSAMCLLAGFMPEQMCSDSRDLNNLKRK